MRTILVSAAIASAMAGACGSFDDPAIVVDLRFLGVIASPPEILIPENLAELDVASLPRFEVCALVADPNASRGLQFEMVVCPKASEGRCHSDLQIKFGQGRVSDSEEFSDPVSICGRLEPSLQLAKIIEQSVSLDSLAGFGAVDIQAVISVWPQSLPEQAVFATKQIRFGIAKPEERLPNSNPSLAGVLAQVTCEGQETAPTSLPRGRCADVAPLVVQPGCSVHLEPEEPEGIREDYVVPTLDGSFRRFTETMRYQYFSTHGAWTRANTGGPTDGAGNRPTLDTQWRAPEAELVESELNVSLFVIQRDERGGQSWFQSCVRVIP